MRERVRERENRPNEALDYAEEMELMGLDQESEREIGGERVASDKDKIWDTNKIINTDHLTDDQWDILADIFKDFK